MTQCSKGKVHLFVTKDFEFYGEHMLSDRGFCVGNRIIWFCGIPRSWYWPSGVVWAICLVLVFGVDWLSALGR